MSQAEILNSITANQRKELKISCFNQDSGVPDYFQQKKEIMGLDKKKI